MTLAKDGSVLEPACFGDATAAWSGTKAEVDGNGGIIEFSISQAWGSPAKFYISRVNSETLEILPQVTNAFCNFI